MDFHNLSMFECGVCGEHVEKLYVCRNCGVKFCEEDGSPEKNLCINCSEIDKENLEGEHEEEREKEHEEEESEKEEEENREDDREDKEEWEKEEEYSVESPEEKEEGEDEN